MSLSTTPRVARQLAKGDTLSFDGIPFGLVTDIRVGEVEVWLELDWTAEVSLSADEPVDGCGSTAAGWRLS